MLFVPSNAAQVCNILIAQRGAPGLEDEHLKAPRPVFYDKLFCGEDCWWLAAQGR